MAKTDSRSTDEIGQECGQTWAQLVAANEALQAVLDDAGLYAIVLGVVRKRLKRYAKSLEQWIDALEEG